MWNYTTKLQESRALLYARHFLCYVIKGRRLKVVRHIADIGQLEGKSTSKI